MSTGDVSEAKFVPLDQGIADAIRERNEVVKRLLSHWMRGMHLPDLPDRLVNLIPDWIDSGLDERRVEGYCAAVSSFVRRILLEESGSLQGSFVLEIVPGRGPQLRRTTTQGEEVISSATLFATHMSTRCREWHEWCELAWWFIVASLDRFSTVLARLTFRKIGEGAFEVNLESQE